MKRDFKQAKKVVKYLEGRYGSIRKHTINDDIVIVNDICDDHSLEEIEMMEKRINASINLNRDTSYVNNHPMNLMVALFTTVSASLLAMVTIGSQMIISYAGHLTNVYDKQITPEILNEMMKSMDFSSIMGIAIVYIGLVFLMLFIGTHIINSLIEKKSNRIYMYSVLIEEAIEKKKSKL